MDSIGNKNDDILMQDIVEGSAIIKTAGQVFYNPVQEFNRDLSILVLQVFSKYFIAEKQSSKRIREGLSYNKIESPLAYPPKGVSFESGITILEALSATGLRSIRYAKEIQGIKKIVANDLSQRAVEDIKRNVENNKIGNIVIPNNNDAIMFMYKHRQGEKFDAIDLDPYGCPSIFLDSAVQAIADGGLLLVTATDMAVLAGNSPETCYAKYGSISLRIKCCHEMAIRILLQCIEAHANRYSRYIVPLLSISADFYIRVFVRVYSGAQKCKFSTSKLSNVYHCTGCDSFVLQPLGILRNQENSKNIKFGLPAAPATLQKCEHCGGTQHMGGPLWSAPMHSIDFVERLQENLTNELGTYRRIEGILQLITEELSDVPLYYTLEKLSGTIHVETPSMLSMRSAILNAGYRVSYTHMNKTSIKTDAPANVIWDIMRSWVEDHPVSTKRLVNDTATGKILAIKSKTKHSFNLHPLANPESKRSGMLRFQANPQPHWGPGTRSTVMVGEAKISKSKRNQGKRKREQSEELETTVTPELS